MSRLRILFMGTPELACASLRALHESPQFQVLGVVTQPDRPKGRDLKLQASPVKNLALSWGLPVLQPMRAREETFISALAELNLDLIAVAAFGQILPKAILDLPQYRCLNVHTSLLPKYRGAAPIQRAILNDESETGVTIMQMDVGLDTGPIVAQETTPILPGDDAISLHDRLAEIGGRLLAATIVPYVNGTLAPRAQPENFSLAPKISKADGLVDWRRPARACWNQVRGLVPWPGAYTYLPTASPPHLLKIWKAGLSAAEGEPGTVLEAGRAGLVVACGQGSLQILELQREGGRRLPAGEFLAGCRISPGTRLPSVLAVGA